jgi:hypothetical protein
MHDVIHRALAMEVAGDRLTAARRRRSLAQRADGAALVARPRRRLALRVAALGLRHIGARR